MFIFGYLVSRLVSVTLQKYYIETIETISVTHCVSETFLQDCNVKMSASVYKRHSLNITEMFLKSFGKVAAKRSFHHESYISKKLNDFSSMQMLS